MAGSSQLYTLLKRFGPTALATTLLGSSLIESKPSLNIRAFSGIRKLVPEERTIADCWISAGRKKRLEQMNTNVYVWGEGQQVDI
jgi:hypothetical protein